MKLKQNKGYIGIDVTVSILAIIILLPIITGMIFNISKSNNTVKRKTQALNIATNVMEHTKAVFIEDDEPFIESETKIAGYFQKIYNAVSPSYSEIEEHSINSDNVTIVVKIDEVLYKIEITMHDKGTEDVNVELGTVETVQVKVTFKVGSETQEVNLKTDFLIK